MEFKKTVTITLYAKQKKRHRCTEQTFRLCGRRWGWDVQREQHWNKYQGWNRSPAQVGCMRQVLRAGALGRPRGMGWGGRWEGGSGWGTHVNPWLIHVNVWQKPLQYCKVISLQWIKINEKKNTIKKMKLQAAIHKMYISEMNWIQNIHKILPKWASQVKLVVENLPANSGDTRDPGPIPRSGRCPVGRHGNPLQYSCLSLLHCKWILYQLSY